VAGREGECGDDVAGLLVRERRSLDILPVKKEAKLSASEVPEEVVGSGEEDLRCSSLLTVCQRRLEWSEAVTGFGSFDNSTCRRALDLLEPGDLRLEQVVIKRVAVVKLDVNNGSGDGGSCFWYRGMDGYRKAGEYGNSKI